MAKDPVYDPNRKPEGMFGLAEARAGFDMILNAPFRPFEIPAVPENPLVDLRAALEALRRERPELTIENETVKNGNLAAE